MANYKIQTEIDSEIKKEIEKFGADFGITGFNNALRFFLTNIAKKRIQFDFGAQTDDENSAKYRQFLDQTDQETEADYQKGKIKAYKKPDELISALKQKQ